MSRPRPSPSARRVPARGRPRRRRVSAAMTPPLAVLGLLAAGAPPVLARVGRGRGLQVQDCADAPAWHPVYALGWADGHCERSVDCDAPAFTTELACCRAAYAGQTSGRCLSSLPDPPTASPTDVGPLDVWYPDYATAWVDAGCINERPLPSGRPAYETQLDCCRVAYAGQVTGTCLSQLPAPPTAAPTEGPGVGPLWYPDYDTAWAEAGCSNVTPFPFTDGSRPTFTSQLACCQGAYGGQVSGVCLSQLESPPTSSPTQAPGEGDLWYPDYDTTWAEAGCLNRIPLPFASGGRPTYGSQLECCKLAYGGQVSGTCLSQLESPPTSAPTEAPGTGDVWYPDYDKAFPEAGCSNITPFPFTGNSRPTYASQLACCQGAYGGQVSGVCLSQLESPPTSSPTQAPGEGDLWYPDYDTAWAEAGCSNVIPFPFTDGSRPTYTSQLACCQGAYGGQVSGVCLSQLESPPTSSPTQAPGEGDLWYPDYDTAWAEAGCLNRIPLPFASGGRPTYGSQLECCKLAYGGQVSGTCLSQLESPPTAAPTEAPGTGDIWYPDYGTPWAEAGCSNNTPFPFETGWRPTYGSQLECCKLAYGGQVSGTCLSQLETPPTAAPTEAPGTGDVWYPDYGTPWAEAGCSNVTPLPFTDGSRPTYDSQLACCQGAYGGQVSGVCLSQLESPPTAAPTEAPGTGDLWYPEYDISWAEAGCSNVTPFPFTDGSRPTYDSHLQCCKESYGGQVSGACLSQLESPPTASPTEAPGTGDLWYPEYDISWAEAGCSNKIPIPSGRPTYDSQLKCCKESYGGQVSGTCLSQLEIPPTAAPTEAPGTGALWYPEYDISWAEAGCSNKIPIPNGRNTYDSQLECCKGAYGSQVSGACLSQLESPPTATPTEAPGAGALWYRDESTPWAEAGCLNETPLPFQPGSRPTYGSQLECCKDAYAGQASGACVSQLPNPLTMSSTESGDLNVFYPDHRLGWSSGKCINSSPLPSGRPTYNSMESCCATAYAGQISDACMCDAVGICFSCKCGTQAERDAAPGGCPELDCS